VRLQDATVSMHSSQKEENITRTPGWR